MANLDDIDRRLLAELQAEGRVTNVELAQRVGLTAPPCLRRVRGLEEDGVIRGGMVPKLETCVAAVQSGCEAAVVLDGRVGHAMLLEFFTARGAGTLVRA